MGFGRTPEDDALVRLHGLLNYQVGSALLASLVFLLPIGIVTSGLYLIAALLTPLMLVLLYRARWFGWMAAFVVLVGAGWLGPRLVSLDPLMIQTAHSVGLFVPFYFYCWILRWVVGDKVSEIKGMEEMARPDAVNRQKMGR